MLNKLKKSRLNSIRAENSHQFTKGKEMNLTLYFLVI